MSLVLATNPLMPWIAITGAGDCLGFVLFIWVAVSHTRLPHTGRNLASQWAARIIPVCVSLVTLAAAVMMTVRFWQHWQSTPNFSKTPSFGLMMKATVVLDLWAVAWPVMFAKVIFSLRKIDKETARRAELGGWPP